jgi:hypothetical protein
LRGAVDGTIGVGGPFAGAAGAAAAAEKASASASEAIDCRSFPFAGGENGTEGKKYRSRGLRTAPERRTLVDLTDLGAAPYPHNPRNTYHSCGDRRIAPSLAS